MKMSLLLIVIITTLTMMVAIQAYAEYIKYDNIYHNITIYPGYLYVNETNVSIDKEYHMDDFNIWNASQYTLLNVRSITLNNDGTITMTGSAYRVTYGLISKTKVTPPYSVEVRYYLRYGIKEPAVFLRTSEYILRIYGGYTNGFLKFRIVLYNLTTGTGTILATGTMYSRNYVWYTLHIDVYENGTVVATLMSPTQSETLKVNVKPVIEKHEVTFFILDDYAPTYGAKLDFFYFHRNVIDVVMPQGKQVIVKSTTTYNLVDWDLNKVERINTRSPIRANEIILVKPLNVARAYTRHSIELTFTGKTIYDNTVVLNITGNVNISGASNLKIVLGTNSSVYIRSVISVDMNRLPGALMNFTGFSVVGIDTVSGKTVAIYERVLIYDGDTLIFNDTFYNISVPFFVTPPVTLTTHNQTIIVEAYAETNETNATVIVSLISILLTTAKPKICNISITLPIGDNITAYSLIDLYKNNGYVTEYNVKITFTGRPAYLVNMVYIPSENETENYEGFNVTRYTSNNTSITITVTTSPQPSIPEPIPISVPLSPYLDFLIVYNNTLNANIAYSRVVVGDNLIVTANKPFNITVLLDGIVYDTLDNTLVYNKTYYGVGKYIVEALRLLNNETGIWYEYVTVEFGKPVFTLSPEPPVPVNATFTETASGTTITSSGTKLVFSRIEKGTYKLTITLYGVKIYEATYEITSANAWNTFTVNLNGYMLSAYNGYKYVVADSLAPTIYVAENNPGIPFSNITVYTVTPSNTTIILIYENAPNDIHATNGNVIRVNTNTFIVEFANETTITDMYVLRVELKDRLGRLLPEQGFSIGSKAYGIEELLPASEYNVSVPRIVEGFKFYKWGDDVYELARTVRLIQPTTLVAEYLVPTSIRFNVTFLNTTPEYFIKAIQGLVPALIEGYVEDYYGQPVPYRNITIEVYINDYLYSSTETKTDGSGYFSLYVDLPYVTSPDKLRIIARTSQDTVYLASSYEKTITAEEIGVTPIQTALLILVILAIIGAVTTLAYYLRKRRS